MKQFFFFKRWYMPVFYESVDQQYRQHIKSVDF